MKLSRSYWTWLEPYSTEGQENGCDVLGWVQQIPDALDSFVIRHSCVLSCSYQFCSSVLSATSIWRAGVCFRDNSPPTSSYADWPWPFSGLPSVLAALSCTGQIAHCFSLAEGSCLVPRFEVQSFNSNRARVCSYQFNCISLGLAVGAAAAVIARQELMACVFFSLSLNHKQVPTSDLNSKQAACVCWNSHLCC